MFYTFKNGDTLWVYDRYSNNIVQVDNFTYELIESYRQHNFDSEKIEELFCKKIDIEQLREKIENFKKSQKELDILKPTKLTYCELPIKEEELNEKYKEGISQTIFNLTENCNMRCNYCKYSGSYDFIRAHNNRSMSYKVIDDSIEFLKKHRKKDTLLHIGFYGGEPLLEFNKIKYIIRKSKSTFGDCDFGLTTNGVLLKDEILSFVVENKLRLLISLDGPKEIHDRNRIKINNKTTFDDVTENLSRVKEYDYDYYVNRIGFSVTLSPPFQLNDVIDFFEKFAVPSQVVMFNFVDLNETNLFIKYDLKAKIKEYSKDKSHILDEYILYKKDSYGDNQRLKILDKFFSKNFYQLEKRSISPLGFETIGPNGACFPGLDRLFITVDGDFAICEKCTPNLTIGNVIDGFNLTKIKSIYDQYCQMLTNLCLNCWAYRLCSSCYMGALNNDGSLSMEKKKGDCKAKLNNVIENLVAYTKIKSGNPEAFTTESRTLNQ